MKNFSCFVSLIVMSCFPIGCSQKLFHEDEVRNIDPAESFANSYVLSEFYEPETPFIVSMDIKSFGNVPEDSIDLTVEWIGNNDYIILFLQLGNEGEDMRSQTTIRMRIKGEPGPAIGSCPRYFKSAHTVKKITPEAKRQLLLMILSKHLDVAVFSDLFKTRRAQRLYVESSFYCKEPFPYFDARLSPVNRTVGIQFKRELSEKELDALKEKHSQEFIEELIKRHSASAEE